MAETHNIVAPSDKIFNILHVISKLPVGGVENMLLKVVKGYNKKRYNVRICCIQEGGKIADELESSGFRVEILNKMKGHGFDISIIHALFNLLKKENIHILRTHQYHANFYGRIAGILAGVPVIVPSFHNLYISPSTPKTHRRIFNYLLSFFSDALIAVSKSVASDMIQYDKVSPEKIKIIYNGISLSEFGIEASKAEARKIFGLPSDGIIIGSVGRLTKQKGHEFLIQASSELRDTYIAIAGDGPLKSYLERLAESLKVRCFFLGRVDPEKIPIFLKALDIFCFPSLWEGFGTALVEAMSVGLPVVASDILPNKEMVEDLEVLVPPGNVEKLANSLKILIQDPASRKIFGNKNKTHAMLFSIEKTVSTYEELFDKILSKKGLL